MSSAKPKKSPRVLVCLICQTQFTKSTAGNPPKTCSEKCRREKERLRSARNHVPKSYSKNCVECGADFQAKAINVVACSKQCQNEVNKKRALASYYKQHPKGLKEIACSWCEQPVIVPSSFTQKIVSHPECKVERKRKRQRIKSVRRRGHRAALKTLSVEQMGDRDDWTCHICEKLIDPLLPYNHKYGATVDHVIPLSRGGTDELDNLKIAHWICNVRKSNKLEWKNA